MGGSELQVEWRGRAVRAWLPDPLSGTSLELGAGTARQTERAAASLVRAADHLPPNWEPVARLLLRTEGVASSYVEGIRAPIVDIAAAERDDRAASATAAWVADNLEAVTDAIADARRGPLDIETLLRWHRRLMVHSDLPDVQRGELRTSQGWVGGSSPLDAAFVPPPPDSVAGLMGDLVDYANRFDIDPVTQSAVVHAQFETIHPFGDGNGRIGRVLIAWLLVRRTDVAIPPPVSVFIARDPGGYLSGLELFRMGEVERWVSWFADVVDRSAGATLTLIEEITALVDDWSTQLEALRADAAARRLIGLLPEMPVLSAPLVAERLGVSNPSARDALAALAERGVVQPLEMKPFGPGRPPAWYAASGLLELVRRWSG